MANEHWEEINEWDIEEDIDLAQRITVHTVRSVDDEEDFQLIQAHKNRTYAAAAKWGDRKSSSSPNNEGTSKANITNKTSEKSEKKSSSASSKDSKDNDKSENNVLKDGHDVVDYENSDPPVSSKDWKETRRNNTKLHKIHSIKLMSSLVSNAEFEYGQGEFVKGDTNRDPEFKKYKVLKKSMAYKKIEKPKSDRKNIGRVEVW